MPLDYSCAVSILLAECYNRHHFNEFIDENNIDLDGLKVEHSSD